MLLARQSVRELDLHFYTRHFHTRAMGGEIREFYGLLTCLRTHNLPALSYPSLWDNLDPGIAFCCWIC